MGFNTNAPYRTPRCEAAILENRGGWKRCKQISRDVTCDIADGEPMAVCKRHKKYPRFRFVETG